MSAESDLLFPQVDSFMLSDFAIFSEYEDFSRDAFLMSETDGFSLLEDLDCKDGVKPLLLSELNEFNSSLEGIKEEDEEDDMHSAKVVVKGCPGTPKCEQRVSLQAEPATDNELCIEGMDMHEAVLSPTEISCISLEDATAQPNIIKSWQASTSQFEHAASVLTDCSGISGSTLEESMPPPTLSSTQGDTKIQQSGDICVTPKKSGITPQLCISESSPLPCRVNVKNVMHAEQRASMNSPIFHINSPLSSPSSSVTTHDGSSMLKRFGHEENGSVHSMNTSLLQPPATSAIDSSLVSLQPGAYHQTIPHHVTQDGSGFSMHRSRSSHALGQFQLSGHIGACPEEFSVSPMQVPIMGYASPNNFPHYQATCSPRLVERSSAAAPMRRVFSTGDIQACNGMQVSYVDNNMSRIDHANGEDNMCLKVGHYTLEERKLRLHRYRQKRNERNFSKKIKYACRKTLADSRPRIRGRFARTLDDSGEPLLKENGVAYDDEYEEVDTPRSMPHNRGVSFWNATGNNLTIQHGR